MFVVALIADTIYVPPHQLSTPTISAVSSIIERRYPNRIICNVGLVICPYGPPVSVGDGVLVPGDGGSHHQAIFNVVVFRPFVEEVLVGTVTSCHEGGIDVSVGRFFEGVFIPAYWMLNPSTYDAAARCWVWTPNYDVDDDDGENENHEEDEEGGDGITTTTTTVKRQGAIENDAPMHNNETEVGVTTERGGEEDATTADRFEIVIGSEIRFKVKAVNFTRITNTMKGVQATTTSSLSSHMSSSSAPSSSSSSASQHQSLSTSDAKGIQQNGSGNGSTMMMNGSSDSDGLGIVGSSSSSSSNYNMTLATTNGGIMVGNADHDNHGGGTSGGGGGGGAVRMRSTSIDISNDSQHNHPAPMQIIGSICEDGLGLISWWKSTAGDDEEVMEEEAEYEEEECCENDMGGNGIKMEED